MKNPVELPPTPSSSYMIHHEWKEPSPRLPSNYGSISTESRAESPSLSLSTVSPNDDNESLYLLWTHQLLQERGFQPSPYKSHNSDDDSDSYSIDSSITDVSIPAPPKKTLSWLQSWFPMC
ncbi:uncharacterized protein B0P05DRAFT_557317 [Gilbertella persicaria]|uniref:uncharacterized protein n=1 Tax=Gilbertella persicaria TaxID=101096 RepID=UPI00221EDC94|nr:uncharacterized protein B0P05DRAFT_557317 [Gilbertella persicaria]KAI8061498.1 hypothetical protein B0P05DRAFT_557317 [Gilbertella persicaria]